MDPEVLGFLQPLMEAAAQLDPPAVGDVATRRERAVPFFALLAAGRAPVDGVEVHHYTLTIADGASIAPEAGLLGYRVERDRLILGPIRVGRDAYVGLRAILEGDTELGDESDLDDLSVLAAGHRIPAREAWQGSPSQRVRALAGESARPVRAGAAAEPFRRFAADRPTRRRFSRRAGRWDRRRDRRGGASGPDRPGGRSPGGRPADPAGADLRPGAAAAVG